LGGTFFRKLFKDTSFTPKFANGSQVKCPDFAQGGLPPEMPPIEGKPNDIKSQLRGLSLPKLLELRLE